VFIKQLGLSLKPFNAEHTIETKFKNPYNFHPYTGLFAMFSIDKNISAKKTSIKIKMNEPCLA